MSGCANETPSWEEPGLESYGLEALGRCTAEDVRLSCVSESNEGKMTPVSSDFGTNEARTSPASRSGWPCPSDFKSGEFVIMKR